MKHFILLSVIISISVCTTVGCRSGHSLSRKKNKKTYNTHHVHKKQSRSRQSSDDPLFDTVFSKKKQHNMDASSSLSKEELRLLRDNDVRKDPYSKSIHRTRSKEQQKRKDWVFGTKNGSYF